MATLKSPFIRFLILNILVGVASFSKEVSGVLGGRKQSAGTWKWKPIKDLTDKYILEISKFAIREHNTQSGTQLEFETVIKGDELVIYGMIYKLYIVSIGDEPFVSGMIYKLIIAAKDGCMIHQYEAIIYERSPPGTIRALYSFKQVD